MTATPPTTPPAAPPPPLFAVELRYEQDVVVTRQRARQVAGLLGLGGTDQTAFATAASELARAAFRHAAGGRVEFAVAPDGARPTLTARVVGLGPADAAGDGAVVARRLCDACEVGPAPGGLAAVTVGKWLPPRRPGDRPVPDLLADVAAVLARRGSQSPLDEVRQHNRELAAALDEVRARQAEVERLNAELAETNRGVLALYAELDERADSLRRANEAKGRFLSDVSHELRTPLNAVVSLAGLLLDRVDGPLTAEQERQTRLIQQQARSLGESVNELLDLAKIDAGKAELRRATFRVADVLGALRGMFRPLATDAVALRVDDPVPADLTMCGDEPKLSQVLRNLVANALKFTERGEVRVTATAGGGGRVRFAVADTGVGIAAADHERVFEDFAQIDGPVQRRSRGTGLGLPLARRLARLMGGDVTLGSEVGRGSTFTVDLPVGDAEGRTIDG